MTDNVINNGSITVNDDGELLLAGRRATALAAEYGTPLVVMLEDVIRRNCREYQRRIGSYPRSRVYYAAKALLTTGICRLMDQEGLGLDVVSAGELQTALQAGFPPERILLHGNAKSRAELQLALDCGVGRIVIDNHAEIDRLAALAGTGGAPVKVFIRVTPGVQPDTHRYIQTGQLDSKFGFNIEGGAAEDAVRRVSEAQGLELVGLHCHIGSQITELEPFNTAARIMLEFYARMREKYTVPLDELNIGGGLGVRYNPGEAPPAIGDHVERLAQTVSREARRLGLPLPVLCDEPGRSIIGEAGVTLYRVESVKRIPGVRNYVSVDGGMADNPRHALYAARHHVVLAQRAGQRGTELWSVSGKACESGDMLARDMELPDPEPGELLAVFSTGAYTYSMASNFNRLARPAVILAGDNGVGVLVRRETTADLTRLDELPEWLAN